MQRTSLLPLACVAALSIVLLASVDPVSAEPSWQPESRAEVLASSIASSESAPAAVAQFAALRRYGDYLTRERYLSLAERVAEEAPAPTVRFRARRLEAGLKLDLGRIGEVGRDGMEGKLGDQGCLTRWQVVGPFDNASMGSFDRRLPPEKGADGPFGGKRVDVEWRPLPEVGDRCRLRVGRTVQPAASAVVYLGTSVEVDSRREATLSIGASGGYRVWVNGEPVAEQRESLGMAFDTRTWAVELKSGNNEILVKLASRRDEGVTAGIRLLDDELEPLSASHRGDVPGEVEAFGRSTEVEATGDGLFERARKCAKRLEPRAVWCARAWRQVASKLAATPWRSPAKRLADAAVGDSGERPADSLELEPPELVQLASLMDEQQRRIELLEAAVAHEEAGPWAEMALASAYGSSPGAIHRQERRKTLEKLHRERPAFWPAGLELGGWYAERGYPARALEIVRSLDVAKPHRRPSLLRRLAGLERRAGEAERAEELQKKLGAIRHRFGPWAGRRVSELAAENEPKRALEIVRSRRKLQPLSTRWAKEEANLLRVLDRAEDAVAVIDELIEARPGEANLRLEKADLLVALDRRAEAKKVLARAEELDPQNQRVSNYLSHLTPESKKFHESWMIEDVRSLAAERGSDDRKEHSRETILDQTVVHVASNGLDQRVVQRVERVNTADGVDAARRHSISYTRGDERVEVLDVRVHEKDGGVLEDYDSWSSGRSRKGSAYYNDLRQRVVRANNVEVGDLVEFRYRVRTIANQNFRGDYFGDLAYLQETSPVGKARYVVEHPATMDLYFRRPGLEHDRIDGGRPGDGSLPDGYQVEGVEMIGVPAVETDPDQPGYADVYDYVAVSNKETWDEIGEWWWNLVDEQLIVSDAIAEKAKALTADLDSERRKVQALHNYVVGNTRYLHVGLGIHGWKPYRTSDVFENKYGDCKDKAALLKVMLEEVGIEANLVLVRTRDLGHVEDVPASMHLFNHAITYVPKFDRFLDPTAEFNGTTELTPMDQGAQALVVEDGGAANWTTLPVDEADDNAVDVDMTVELSPDAAPTVDGRLRATGQRAVGYRRSLQDTERRDSDFEKRLAREFPGVELTSASYSDLEALEQPVEIDFEFQGGRLERRGSSGPYLLPSGTEKELQSRHADQSERQQDLKISVPYTNHRTVRYRLSGDREFGSIPESTTVEGEFGSFSVDYEHDGSELIVDTRYRIDTQRVPVEKYGEFREFLGEVTSELNQPISVESGDDGE